MLVRGLTTFFFLIGGLGVEDLEIGFRVIFFFFFFFYVDRREFYLLKTLDKREEQI